MRPGDTASTQYADAANWVSFLFGIYNGVAALYALLLPFIAKRLGQRGSHALSLAAGGISLVSMFFIGDPAYLVVPMVGIGVAWGSILAMPYAILSKSLPTHKMGVYMGIFNFFITFPQIVNGFFRRVHCQVCIWWACDIFAGNGRRTHVVGRSICVAGGA